MKRIHLVLTDDQHVELKKLKEERDMTWEEFVIYSSQQIPEWSGGE